MKYSKSTLVVLLIAASSAGSITLVGCQDREVSMSIVNVRPIDPENCTPVEDTTVFQTNGTIDMALRNNYQATLMVENNLVDVANAKGFSPNETRISTNAIMLRSATIEFSALDQLTAEIPPRRNIPLSGTISEETQLMLTGVEILDANTVSQIRNSQEFISTARGEAKPVRTSVTLLARIRLKGETIDGREAESNEFLYPIEVCNGCRVLYPPDMVTPRGGYLTCPSPSPDIEVDAATSETCESARGMDGLFVDCQTCQGIAVDSFARQLCQPPRTP